MMSKLRKYINYDSKGWKYLALLTPNQWTLFGFSLSVFAGIEFFRQNYLIGGIFVALSGIVDLIDGGVARYTSKKSEFGAIFDASIDRLGEGAVYAGLVKQFPQAILALIFSYMVSYVRAKKDEIKIGIAERGERIIMLFAFAAFNQMNIGLYIITILTGISFLMRLNYARNYL